MGLTKVATYASMADNDLDLNLIGHSYLMSNDSSSNFVSNRVPLLNDLCM